MVTPITVPGDFIAPAQGTRMPASILPQLRDTVSKFIPIPTSCHGSPNISMPSNLQNSDYVFIRRDGKHSPLKSPYEGPFHVLEKGPKFFKIDFCGKADTISIDRLKPAHLDVSKPIQVAKPQRRGCLPTKKILDVSGGGGGGGPVAVHTTLIKTSSMQAINTLEPEHSRTYV